MQKGTKRMENKIKSVLGMRLRVFYFEKCKGWVFPVRVGNLYYDFICEVDGKEHYEIWMSEKIDDNRWFTIKFTAANGGSIDKNEFVDAIKRVETGRDFVIEDARITVGISD